MRALETADSTKSSSGRQEERRGRPSKSIEKPKEEHSIKRYLSSMNVSFNIFIGNKSMSVERSPTRENEMDKQRNSPKAIADNESNGQTIKVKNEILSKTALVDASR